MVDTAIGNQPATSKAAYLKEANLQYLPMSSGSNNSDKGELAQIEEELSLISAGMLPPRYKDLISTSVHLAPLHFHESVRYYPQKKRL